MGNADCTLRNSQYIEIQETTQRIIEALERAIVSKTRLARFLCLNKYCQLGYKKVETQRNVIKTDKHTTSGNMPDEDLQTGFLKFCL